MSNRNKGETLANASYFSSFEKQRRKSYKLQRDVKDFARYRLKERKFMHRFLHAKRTWTILHIR